MSVFTYAARDESGALVEGEVQALSQQEVARILRGEGKFIVRAAPKGKLKVEKRKAKGERRGSIGASPVVAAPRSAGGGKYKPDDLIFFTNQLAVMVDTGVSLAEALEACVHEGNSPRFARALDDVIDQVEGGSEFSAALAAHPKIFPTVYVSLMRASEASGTMGPMLRRLADYIEAQREIAKKIKGAVTYPIVMLVFALGVTIFMMTFVLPKFAKIYTGREDKLPTATKYLMAVSDGLMSAGPYLGGLLIAAAVGSYFYFRSPDGRLKLEAIKLRIPLIGKLFHKTYLARSLRTLGTMLQSGVDMLEGVKLTAAAAGSPHYARMWEEVCERLESGQQISEALADNKHIPRAVNKMLGAGERSGQLGPVMERIASFCEAELNIALKTLTSMLEPAIVAFLGIVVGGLVIALLLPIFTISKAMR